MRVRSELKSWGYVVVIVGLAILLVGSPATLLGQSTSTGMIVGTVNDATGAIVQGVKITITDSATGDSRSTVTNDTGHYVFVNVAPGQYSLTASKQGFSNVKTTLQVQVGQTATTNLSLPVGGATVTVEVQAAATELQTMNATVGNTVSETSIDSLPSLNRDVSTFVELQPGVSPDGSVAGAVVDQSSFMLDGGNNTNDMDGSMSVYTASFAGDPTGGVSNQSYGVAAGPTGVIPTPADSVEEFKVNTAGQTADFNSSAGAEVQVVTRRGTNTYHGSVYEYYLDNNWSANTWDNNLAGVAVPDWHRSRFGFRFGGKLLPEMAGGKTYFFVNYEGYRWPNSQTFEAAVPSADMRLGLLTFGGTTYNLNPTPVTSAEGVLYAGNAGCSAPGSGFTGGVCDPRGIGINTLVQQMWAQYMPMPNELTSCGQSRCDGVNIQGFLANLAIPQTSNFGVIRVDHDFGEKWHFTSSYRYFKLATSTTDQVDIGGFFPGDKLGVPSSLSHAPQEPWYLVTGLTTKISPTVTNDIHYSFLRNWWAWSRQGDTIQFPGLGGALEPLGEQHYQSLSPYNVNTQQTRTRFWDGRDQMLRDDVSMLKGNHLFQFGGTYQHNFNWHQRTDNGGGINYQPVYQLSASSATDVSMSGVGYNWIPPSGSATAWGRDYTAALGMVSIAQQAYTRSGANLTLNPPLTPAFDQSTIPYYNVYFSDTWHMKPTFTLTYGLGWTLEMPPVESSGKQIELVDQANQLLGVETYLHTREQAALQGQAYNPIVGFNLVGNSANGLKYPYNPFYGSFSPRFAAAWNPHFDSDSTMGKIFGTQDTVIRGGYGRVYGRLNGVDLVLVPLLGTGLIQPVQCFDPLMNGTTCAGSGGSTPATAFRVSTDGLVAPLPSVANGQITQTLPQPLYPGINGIAAGAGESLDPNFRPNYVDSFDFTIQRQLHRGLTLELGYIGRRIEHEYQPININAVPYMMTMGGQRFDKAYANMMVQYCGGIANLAGTLCTPNAGAVSNQPFFEAALAGTGYCNGFTSCTQAVLANEGVNGTGNLVTSNTSATSPVTTYSPLANVWSFWSDLDGGVGCPLGTHTCTSVNGSTGGAFAFPNTMMNTPINCPTGTEIGCSGQLTSGVGVNASIGHANYNGGFVSLKMSDWHGLTTQSNLTWSKTLSTGSVVQATSEETAPDPYNLNTAYGLAGFDRKFVYNLFFVYQPPFYKGQQGLIGHILGGWTFAPVFTAGTGLPITLGTINGGGQAFGEGDSSNFFGNGNSENAVPVGPVHTGLHYVNQTANPGSFPNIFSSDPAQQVAAYNLFRQPILGLDTHDGGWGVIRGLPYWNMDLSIRKNFKITERFNFEFQSVFINALNHVVFSDPPGDYLDTSAGPDGFGTVGGQGNTPRTMEFGLRLSF
ncbi:MAG: carboxypeptidase-like regulatory domain-containing protein [Candidatus Sulfotelmatobacter sp.]